MSTPVIVLQMERLGDGTVLVRALESPIGEPRGVFEPPYAGALQAQAVALALEAVGFDRARWAQVPELLLALRDLNLADEEGFRHDLAEQIGRSLYAGLFSTGDMREAVHAALNATANSGTPARVELRFDKSATDLAAYPWELMYDEERGFLFSGRRASLVRYVSCSLPRPQLAAAGELELLLVTARPVSETSDPVRVPLLLSSEQEAIDEGLAGALREGRVRTVALPAASAAHSTWDLLSQHLGTAATGRGPGILHFDGHGGFGLRCPRCRRLNPAGATHCLAAECGQRLGGKAAGYLAFEGRDRRPAWVSATELGNLLYGTGVQLAVLTACKSAVVAGQSLFHAVAPALIQAGIPAVVSMQFSVTAGAAFQFIRLFYLSLGNQAPVVTAMSAARAGLFADETAWYRPVLYLRTDETNREGMILAPAPEQRVLSASPAREPATAAVARRNEDVPLQRETREVDRRDAVVAALLECPSIRSRDTREAIIGDLPDEIQRNLRDSSQVNVVVRNLVSTCLNYPGGIRALIEAVRSYEGTSLSVQRLDEAAAGL